jgi:putative nucleotidyltransferase with HDIG domain
MAEKRLLIADADARVWDEFRQALGESWVVVGAASGDAALAEAQKQPFNVVVANYDLPRLGGAGLLNRIRVANPDSLRFIAADAALKEKVMCHVLGGHQFLAIPFDRATLKTSIERSVAADYGMSNSMRELVGRIRTFPTIPSLYVEVVNALQNPNATTADIGAIIARDMAMTTKLVQVLNSAYFALPRAITDPTEAVGLLGFETIKSLILTVKLLSQYDKVKPVYFSIDNIWRHSTRVARTAKVMALLETGNTDCSGAAYTAGLMHDLGKVILAANFDDQYHGAHAVARKRQIPLWEVEKDIFGASHGEIGAYMLALWGLPAEVVKVAALHHHPLRAGDKTFTALTAVHVANVLDYGGNSDADGLPAPVVDLDYLQQLGLEKRVELWRFARRDSDTTKFETTMQRAKSVAKPADKAVQPVPAPAPRADKFAPAELPLEPSMFRALCAWLGIGLGASAALVLLARFEVSRLECMAEKTRVQEAVESPPPVKQEIAAVVAPVAPNHVAPGPAVQPPPAPVPAAAPPPAPAKTAFDLLKLEAIFFSSQHPSALINGRLACVNQEVANCRVLDISPSSVTLGYQDQRKTLTLR